MNYISIYNEINDSKINIEELEDLISSALEKEKIENSVVNVIFVDNSTIKKINKEYRNKDSITDVISFALEDGFDFPTGDLRVLGDIYISVEKAEEQSREYNHSFRREISFLAIHGLLHLLGYSHDEEEEERKMFERQEMILNEYGIKR